MIEDFNPVAPILGGILIGLSATLFWVGLGRIAGISGLLGRLLTPDGNWAWRLAFLFGLPLGAIFALAMGWADAPSMPKGGWPVVVAGGLLVGFGTRLGGGCTSGHGICGLARFSPRSLAAVLVFMACGMASVFVMRHVLAG
jgi:uncharacterized membrane protein YedE/YeeE